jgi:hypothetical protein
MRTGKISATVIVLLFAGLVVARAEEKFGVKVYAGAKFDAATSKSVSESMSINAACYRTNDGVAKVVEFYKKQPGAKYIGGDKESAMVKKGDVDITVQNPWMNMQTGQLMKDTLISIVKQLQESEDSLPVSE